MSLEFVRLSVSLTLFLLIPHLIATPEYLKLYANMDQPMLRDDSQAALIFTLAKNTTLSCTLLHVCFMFQHQKRRRRFRPSIVVIAMTLVNSLISSLCVKLLLNRVYLNYLHIVCYSGSCAAIVLTISIFYLSGRVWMIGLLCIANCLYSSGLYSFAFGVWLRVMEYDIL